MFGRSEVRMDDGDSSDDRLADEIRVDLLSER
jgi:hypothetical protein